MRILAVVVAILVLLAAAAWLKLRGPDIPYATLEAKYTDADSRFTDLPGGLHVHYEDEGNPELPLLVLLHGYGDSYTSWDGWVSALKDKFHIIRLDFPGHGLTRAPEGYRLSGDGLADFVDAFAGALELPPFAVAGNSMGGGVAWQLALRHPERVNALILVDAAGFPNEKPPAKIPLAFKILQYRLGRAFLQSIDNRPLIDEGLKTDVYDKSVITPAVVDRWAEFQRAPGHRAILMAVNPAAFGRASADSLHAISVPTLVLQGENDLLVEPASARKFAAAIPAATLILYPHVGHLPQIEIPQRSAADVAQFLQRGTEIEAGGDVTSGPPRRGSGIIGDMQHDYLGNPWTCVRSDTATAVDDFIEGFLAYETRAEGIVRAADADADCCIANVYAGLLWMLLEAPEAAQHAAKYHAAADRTAGGATAREQSNAAVLRAWIAGDLPEAIRLAGDASDRFPRDLVMVKLLQYFEFNRGNSPAMLRAVLKVLDHNADVAYVHGMAAFAYEQCHLLNEAEQAARTALGIKRKEPWAQHALAHVMLTRGRVDEGARFLEGIAGTWTGLNSFMLTHLWWHLALFKLSQGRFADVLDIYDRRCWGVAKDYSQDQIGAVSLLARMEIAGIDVGERWQDLGDHLAARAGNTVLPFLTLQYLYGLARARRSEADSLLQAVRTLARSAPAHAREVWREVALPAGEGVYAYAQGAYDNAWRHLSRAMPRLSEIGGSHAQRDLFDQILLDTAIKAKRTVAAQQMLELRRAADPQGVPLNTALGEVYAELGLAGLSREARLRAAATRARHPR